MRDRAAWIGPGGLEREMDPSNLRSRKTTNLFLSTVDLESLAHWTPKIVPAGTAAEAGESSVVAR